MICILSENYNGHKADSCSGFTQDDITMDMKSNLKIHI